ncbi:CCA tRNA nucleotidyltransferase [Methylobacterium radiodurans]|uniref:CCA tRNA nucleotidyltransferase n=1 Tax=Methylobacterium radiodurans TaxID=2202828 RepID=A0A2U8VXN0_9HYPH|nr:CCA tRNA nucleotidyltransferase [Methylobacterium radiodurans]AWN38030.1 CCA tRNA nucleotidyltransferase [Methylobacterium radiodurans]
MQDLNRHNLDARGLARLRERPGVRAALAALAGPGAETRLVGGCVRDALLGRDAADIDLATTHLPEAVMERTRAAGLKAVPTGIEHGTVTVIAAGEPIEVTTLREDVETDGRHAVVRFGGDFAQDAARRDFTVNALSLDAEGRLHDTTDGVADLAAGRVRFIGDPATRIREDALRILRFFRFHARFGGGAPDAQALAACIAARDSLDRLSRERVRAEFLKLLAAPGALAMVAVLSETGLLARILGGVGELGRLDRALAAGQPAPLAALAVLTREDAERLRERLRLSNAEHQELDRYAAALAAARSRDTLTEPEIRALAAVHGLDAAAGALAVMAGEPRPALPRDAGVILEALRVGPPLILPVTGADLVERGLAPGRAVGQALARARARWLALGCPLDPESREALITHALDGTAI